jgi:hypothetical protein
VAKKDRQVALNLPILKTLSQLASMHGYGTMPHIRRVSSELLIVEEGALPCIAPHGRERLGPRPNGKSETIRVMLATGRLPPEAPCCRREKANPAPFRYFRNLGSTF